MYSLQLQQSINLAILIFLGYFTAYIYLPLLTIISILFFSIIWEHFLIYIKFRVLRYFSFSALSTAFGTMLMMATPHIWIYMVAIAAGLVQKHFLLYRGKHIFNPSNFSLMIALIFFYKDAHIVLGQLGDAIWLGICVLFLATIILWQAKRWLIPIVFSCSYLLFQYAGIVQYDPVIIFEDIYERFYSVSFIVFILFMLTDPRTTPSKKIFQSCFAISIALVATLMDYIYGFRVQHLFMALFVITAVQLLLQKGLPAKNDKVFLATLLFLVLSAIIYIEIQPPYYYEMDGS